MIKLGTVLGKLRGRRVAYMDYMPRMKKFLLERG